MKKCRLCQTASADQTGSHITSCFIVASMLGERDYEKGFLLSSGNDDYGVNRQADEIKEDYLFCRGCELRLSYLEGYFSQEYTSKIDQARFGSNFIQKEVNGTRFHAPTQMNSFAFHLLINSILWRAHLSVKPLFANFRIPKPAAKQIRLTLDTVLPSYENYKVKGRYSSWIKDIESVKYLVKFYPHVIMRTNQGNQNTGENLIYFSDVEKHPFHVLINEFVILAFFIGKPPDFSKQDYFELSKKYDLGEILNNTIDDLRIGNLQVEDWRFIRDKLHQIIKDRYTWRRIVHDCIHNGS